MYILSWNFSWYSILEKSVSFGKNVWPDSRYLNVMVWRLGCEFSKALSIKTILMLRFCPPQQSLHSASSSSLGSILCFICIVNNALFAKVFYINTIIGVHNKYFI